jgi:hypothetical protein
MKINGDEKAKGLFEFVSKNSEVEWSQIKYGSNSNYISTANEAHQESGGADLLYKLTVGRYHVREHTHSHPTSIEGPSGFKPDHEIKGDLNFSKWVNSYYPNGNVKLNVYEVLTNKYIQYDHNGVK